MRVHVCVSGGGDKGWGGRGVGCRKGDEPRG